MEEEIKEDKKIVVIGSTGTGKSVICNVLAGKKHDDKEFPVSEDMDPCTNMTVAKRVSWRGNSDFPITLIDTPGLNDPEKGKDSLNIAEMTKELIELEYINVFLIVFNGSNPRFDDSLIAMLQIFRNMFGIEFLEKNTVFEFSNWAHDEQSVRRRGTRKNESHWIAELNRKLKELVGSEGIIPSVFLDSLYDEDDDQQASKFEEEIKKLEHCLRTFPKYPCKDFKAIKTELDQAEEEKKKLKTKAEEVKTQLDQAEKEKSELTAEAEKVKAEANKVKAELDQAEDKAEVENLKKEVEKLKKENENLEKEVKEKKEKENWGNLKDIGKWICTGIGIGIASEVPIFGFLRR